MDRLIKNENIKRIFILPFIVLVGALVGTVLLVAAFALPVNQSRLAETMATIEGQMSYHNVLDMRECSYFFSSLPGVLDTATDSLMFEKALNASGDNLLYEAMDIQGYSYYWHGYIVILRVLCLFFNYTDIRFLNFIIQFLMVICFAQLLYRRKGTIYSFLFLTSYLLLMPIALYFCLQFSWIFYIALGASFLVLKWSDFLEVKGRYLYLFVIIGVATCYFDLLTYPLISWAYPVLWWILVSAKERKAFEYVKGVVTSGLAWILGYGGMWILKCLFATWVLGRDVLGTAADEVLLRAGVQEQVTWHIRWETILANLEHYKYKVYVFAVIIWLVWFLYKVVFSKTVTSSKVGALLLVGVSPLVWYTVLSNHTSVHHFFTYRIFNISVLALCGCMVSVVSMEKMKARLVVKQVLHVVVAGLLVFVCTFCSREESTYGNGAYHTKEEMQLIEGQTATMEFYPAENRLTQFGVQFEPVSEEGFLVFRLMSEESEVYSREISFSEFKDDGICYFDVDWNLRKEKYIIQLEVQGKDAKGILSSALTGSIMLEECGQVTVDGTPVPGQLLICFTYNYRALPQGVDFIYTLLFWGFIVMPVYFGVKESAAVKLKSLGKIER